MTQSFACPQQCLASAGNTVIVQQVSGEAVKGSVNQLIHFEDGINNFMQWMKIRRHLELIIHISEPNFSGYLEKNR